MNPDAEVALLPADRLAIGNIQVSVIAAPTAMLLAKHPDLMSVPEPANRPRGR